MWSVGKSGGGSELIFKDVLVLLVVVVVLVSGVVAFLLFLLAFGVARLSSGGVGVWFLDGLGVETADEDSSSSIGMVSSSSSWVMVVLICFSSFFPGLVVGCFCAAILLLTLVGVGRLAMLPWLALSLPLLLMALVAISGVCYL
jgi:asparagine N-glycosylation enzyme membrane subunit Stt3